MLDPLSDTILIQVKQLAEQQKKLNRQIGLFNIWFVWACAFLILSVGDNYRKLNEVNCKYLYFLMSTIFMLSLLAKHICWKRRSVHQLRQSQAEVFVSALKLHLSNQINLVLNHLITFLMLIIIGSVFYQWYIPHVSALFWIIITPVSTVMFVFSGLFLSRLKRMINQINRTFPEFFYD